jgi:uncharacterized membrane protein
LFPRFEFVSDLKGVSLVSLQFHETGVRAFLFVLFYAAYFAVSTTFLLLPVVVLVLVTLLYRLAKAMGLAVEKVCGRLQCINKSPPSIGCENSDLKLLC